MKTKQITFAAILIVLFTISAAVVQAGPPPCANSITSVTTTHADGIFIQGEIIDINANYNASVNVSTAGGTPYITLNSRGTAQYFSGNTTTNLTFRYTVANSENTNDLDYNTNSSLILNGGTIIDTTSESGACTTLPAVGTFAAEHSIIVESRRGPRGQPTQAYLHQKIP